MDKAKLITLEQANRQMSGMVGSAQKVTKALRGEFSIPKKLTDFAEWFRKNKRFGVAGRKEIVALAEEWKAKTVKDLVEAFENDLLDYNLEDSQLDLVPDAIKKFEEFAKNSINIHASIHGLLTGQPAKQPEAPVEQEPEANVEMVEDVKPKGKGKGKGK